MKSQNFLFGTFILTASILISKLLGAIYRIPLTNLMGAEGIGIYQLIFPLYSLLLVFSSSGLPNALSKIISEKNAQGKKKDITKILKICIKFWLLIALALSLLLLLFAKPLSILCGNEKSFLGFLAIAPALIFVTILSIFRGYFQGMKNFYPTAISNVIEQLFKLILGLVFAYALLNKGLTWSVFGAIFGVTISEIIATLIIFLQYLFNKKAEKFKILIKNTQKIKKNAIFFHFFSKERKKHYKSISSKQYLKYILKSTTPIMASGFILPFSIFIDSFLIVNLLTSSGLITSTATNLYGLLTGVVNSLINLPIVMTCSVATCIIPHLSTHFYNQNYTRVNNQSLSAIKLVYLFSLPCCIIFILCSHEIISFLYSSGLTAEQIITTSQMLKLASINILLISLLQVTTSILQSINKSLLPIKSLLFAIIIKIILTIILVQIPELNIYGAIIASISCYFIALLINLIGTLKYVKLKFNFYEFFIIPIFALSFMTYVILMLQNILKINIYFELPLIAIFSLFFYIFILFSFNAFDMKYFKNIIKLRSKNIRHNKF